MKGEKEKRERERPPLLPRLVAVLNNKIKYNNSNNNV